MWTKKGDNCDALQLEGRPTTRAPANDSACTAVAWLLSNQRHCLQHRRAAVQLLRWNIPTKNAKILEFPTLGAMSYPEYERKCILTILWPYTWTYNASIYQSSTKSDNASMTQQILQAYLFSGRGKEAGATTGAALHDNSEASAKVTTQFGRH